MIRSVRQAGLPLAILSNWQRGLRYLCEELGLRHRFDAIVCSAEVEMEKPDPDIFHEAARRLGVSAADILHVGDSLVDDIGGARAAGSSVVWLNRDQDTVPDGVAAISTLADLLSLIPAREWMRS